MNSYVLCLGSHASIQTFQSLRWGDWFLTPDSNNLLYLKVSNLLALATYAPTGNTSQDHISFPPDTKVHRVDTILNWKPSI